MGEILLLGGMVLSLASIPFGFPGTIFMLICVLVYAVLTHFSAGIGVGFFVMLCILTVISETADNWMTALGVRRFGGSSGSMWLSFLGGLIGAILFGAPAAALVGPLGPIVGGFAGAFLAVVLNEYSKTRDSRQALRAGWGTFVGRMAGMVLKVVIGVTMMIAVAVSIFMSG